MTDRVLHPSMRPVRPRDRSPRLPRMTPKRSHHSWRGRFVPGPQAGPQAQRVFVNARLVRPGTHGLRSLVASTALELRYMEKGDKGHEAYALYRDVDREVPFDARGFAQSVRMDPHQWRFIVAPERSHAVDLTGLTRQTMAQMDQDTGYRLAWVAVNHYDTPHPHTHILVRGLDQEGQVVGLKRDYLTHGLLYRTQDLLTQELGLRGLEHTREHAYEHGYVRHVELERDRP